MIIGAFAGTVYGLTRVTYDIDMIVGLNDEHVQALADAVSDYPVFMPIRKMIRNSIRDRDLCSISLILLDVRKS